MQTLSLFPLHHHSGPFTSEAIRGEIRKDVFVASHEKVHLLRLYSRRIVRVVEGYAGRVAADIDREKKG